MSDHIIDSAGPPTEEIGLAGSNAARATENQHADTPDGGSGAHHNGGDPRPRDQRGAAADSGGDSAVDWFRGDADGDRTRALYTHGEYVAGEPGDDDSPDGHGGNGRPEPDGEWVEWPAETGAAPEDDGFTMADAEVLEERRTLRQRSIVDTVGLGGSVAAALALVWIGYQRLLPLSGLLGFAVAWYLIFLLVYALVIMQRHGRVEVVDRLVAVLLPTGGLVVGVGLVLVIGFTVVRGVDALSYGNFYTHPLLYRDPHDLSQGGMLHAVIGTLEQLSISVAVTLPLGVACAVFMTEVRGRLARLVRTIIEAMTALPSIVAGLFVFVSVVLLAGFNRSGFAASLALSVMMLPIVTRSSDVVLRLVPGGLREASLALGATQWQTIWRVVLPTARPGLATALILGMARGVGETSPVLLTAGYSQFINANPLNGAQTSLPLFVYNTARLPDESMVSRAFGGATALLAIVLVLFVTARVLAANRKGGRS